MNIASISNLLPGLIQPCNHTASAGNVNQSLNSLPLDSAPDLSPVARFLNTLEQLDQQDPTRFKQLTASIADRLRQAAKNAQSSGNSERASELNKLADVFQNASTSGQVPSLQDLQQAGLSAHHHHGHHGAYHPDSTGQTNPLSAFQDLLNATPDSSANGTVPSEQNN